MYDFLSVSLVSITIFIEIFDVTFELLDVEECGDLEI